MGKLFVPIQHNGSGFVRAAYATSLLIALSGRPLITCCLGYPYPDGLLNILSALFLQSDCDRMLIIDGDQLFSKDDVDKLLAHDLPLIFGTYVKKAPGMEFTVETFDNKSPVFSRNHPMLWSVKAAARGFMAMKREVLEAMKPHCETFPCNSTGKDEAIFWKGLPGGHSEDFEFCHRWRDMGNEVLVDPTIFVGHIGECAFPLQSEIALMNQPIERAA